jgi:hypothetical protein
MQKVYDVAKDPEFKNEREYAYNISEITPEKVATGILFRDDKSLDYVSRLPYRKEVTSLLRNEVKDYNIDESIARFT